MIKALTLIIIYFFIQFSIFAFPILLDKEVYAKEGVFLHLDKKEDWKKIENVSDSSLDINCSDNQKICTLSFILQFEYPEISPEDMDESISIRFPYLANVYSIYLNQNKIASGGEIIDDIIIKNGFVRNKLVILPTRFLKKGTNEVSVLLSGDPKDHIALYGKGLLYLDYLSQNTNDTSEKLLLSFIMIYFFTFFYHLMIYIRNQDDEFLLLFSLFCLFIGIYSLLRTNLIFEFGIDPYIIRRIEYSSLFLASAVTVRFYRIYLNIKKMFATNVYKFLSILFSILVLFIPIPYTYKILLFWQTLTVIMACILFYHVFRKTKFNSLANILFFLGSVLLILCTIGDILGTINIFPGLKNFNLSSYGFFVLIVIISHSLAQRFADESKMLSSFQRNLELKVSEKEEESRRAFQEISDLKEEQDVDYYLTTKLVSPFMNIESHGEFTRLSFISRQKKIFIYKDKTYEIGGDICMGDKITLRSRSYTVFLNGDAMGKSIQGASGALVLGVVFRSIIKRTEATYFSKLLPEQWLKVCFIEIQNIFKSFEGNMMTSLLLGMLEEDTGTLYSINADHPNSVCYRDKKAFYIDEVHSMYKVGVSGLPGKIKIHVFPLKKYDIIIIGSDGREDLYESLKYKSKIKISREEFLFIVEESKGDLEEIADRILKKGNLSDDFTLMRLEYEKVPLWEENFSEIEMWKKRSEEFEMLGHHVAVKGLCEKYYNCAPFDNVVMFRLAKSCSRTSDFVKAADFSESLRLRDPENIENLKLLVEIYERSGNSERADKIKKEIEELS